MEGCPMSSKLSSWINAQITSYKMKASENKRLGRIEEAARRVQVKEFDNMLCLSIDGVPILPMREFNKQMLSDARLTLYNYLNTK